MKNDLYVVAVLTAKAGKADALRELLLPAVEAFRREEGCKAYALHEDTQQAGRFVSYEVWRDKAALDGHMKSAAMQQAAPELEQLLDGDMQQYLLDTLLQL